jgi:hypothetical protein
MSGAKTDSVSPQESKQLQSTFLTGGVDHSEILPAMNNVLTPGNNFNLNALKPSEDKNRTQLNANANQNTLQGNIKSNNIKADRHAWYKLPKGLNGTMDSSYEYRIYDKDLKTGAEDFNTQRSYFKRTSIFGTITDKQGSIWEYNNGNAKLNAEGTDRVIYQYYAKQFPAYIDANNYTEYSLWKAVEVKKQTNKIIASYQCESISHYYLIGPNTVRCDQSVKTFGANGKPTYLSKYVVFYKIIKPFSSAPSEADYQSFKLFLTEKGWTDLIPP